MKKLMPNQGVVSLSILRNEETPRQYWSGFLPVTPIQYITREPSPSKESMNNGICFLFASSRSFPKAARQLSKPVRLMRSSSELRRFSTTCGSVSKSREESRFISSLFNAVLSMSDNKSQKRSIFRNALQLAVTTCIQSRTMVYNKHKEVENSLSPAYTCKINE